MSDLVLTQKSFEPIKQRFINLTKEETFLKEASFAIQLANKSPQLQKCSQETVMQSLLNVAQIGLTLNPVFKLAYLIPRWNSVTRSTECCLEPSYQGLVKLLTDTGSVKSISVHVVHENDSFEYELGIEPKITHKPTLRTKGELIAVYAVAHLPNGAVQVEVMGKDEVYLIRERSESYKALLAGKIQSTVWTTDEAEMWRKTVIRRIAKYLPKTERWEKLANAISLDEKDYKITDGQSDYIESLLETSSISPERKAAIFTEKDSYSSIDAEKVILYLKDNQLDPIASGKNYSQTDINNKLNTLR